MTSDMKKTPSYLKGLAETRARAAGDFERLQALHDQVGVQLAKARTELEACDVLIRKFDQRLNPDLICPIRAHQGRCGKRGTLRHAIIAYLRERASAEVTTTELTLALQVQFRLDFLMPAERQHWQHNSLVRELKRLVEEGLLERGHDASVNDGGVGRWRWRQPGAASLQELREQAKVAGVAVVVAQTGDPEEPSLRPA